VEFALVVFKVDDDVVWMKVQTKKADYAHPDGKYREDDYGNPEEQTIEYDGHCTPLFSQAFFCFMRLLTTCYLQRIKQASLDPPRITTLTLSAAVLWCSRQISIDIDCGKPASRRCCYRSTGQTDGRTDIAPFHRRSPPEAGSVNKSPQF